MNKMLVCCVLFFAFFEFNVVYALQSFENLKVFNVDTSFDKVVTEHEELVDGAVYHQISFYDTKSCSTKKILSNDGKLINNDMYFPSISEKGDYIVYTSRATNITGDTLNYCTDIVDRTLKVCNSVYLYDVKNEKSYLLKMNGENFNGDSYVAKISGNGENIVFESYSTNLVSKKFDCNTINGISSCINIYKYNILTKKTSLISTKRDSYGSNSNSISPSISFDGRYITFQSNASNLVEDDQKIMYCYNYATAEKEMCTNIYLVDSLSNSLKLITSNNGNIFNNHSSNSFISSKANYVVFESYANNINEINNNLNHIYIYDVQKNSFNLITSSEGVLNNRDSYLYGISDDENYIIYNSYATNLDKESNLYVYSLNSEKTDSIKIPIAASGISAYRDDYIFYYDINMKLQSVIIDESPPIINKSHEIYILRSKIFDVKDKISVLDNLCEDSEIQVYVDGLEKIISSGKYKITVTAIDDFGNISIEDIDIYVIDEDFEGPVFNDVNEIKVLKGSNSLNLSEYITAYDKIDGNTIVYLINDGGLNLDTAGNYRVNIMSSDSSNNVTYKEIKVIVYENYDFRYFYQILAVIGVFFVIIFSIIKVK